MSTKTFKVEQRLNAVHPNSMNGLGDYADLTAEISHSDHGVFLGIRLYHEEQPEGRADRRIPFGYPYRVITRGTMGTGEESTVDIPTDYLIRTFTAESSLMGAAKAIDHHLNHALLSSLQDSSQKLIDENEWCKHAYLDQVVLPVSTVLLAMCQDASLIEQLDSSKPLRAIPLWYIQMAYGARNQQTNDDLSDGLLVQDVFVTTSIDKYNAIFGAYHRR